ncbi:MAG: NAD-dependent epimerase/dehydratase, partial [Deltaproteobacteria bacterium]|nr:NAD-dependent epimerase/dehydratase [Deltaproteobacteria bacterium]
MASGDTKRPVRKILVTGGAGYVGSTFIRDALARGYEVRCLDLLVYGGKALVGFLSDPRFTFHKGDVRDEATVREQLEGVDAVVHLAAIVGDMPCQAAPVSTYQINYQGTELVAATAREMGVGRFVFASTCSNYGIVHPGEIADEDHPLRPVSLYAETKIDAERVVTGMVTDAFAPTALRFGTAYGVSFRTRFDLLVNSF